MTRHRLQGFPIPYCIKKASLGVLIKGTLQPLWSYLSFMAKSTNTDVVENQSTAGAEINYKEIIIQNTKINA